MRILLNGSSLVGRRTGIGQYGLRLLGALAALPSESGLTHLAVFDGRHIVPASEFLQSFTAHCGTSRYESLRKVVRRLWPGCRDWADRRRHRRLERSTSNGAWSVFHEPNFVSPHFDLPLVTTVHDMGYLRYPEFLPRDRLAWLRRRMNTTFSRSRMIVADSHFTRRELLELCPHVEPQRVVVTHLGVDLDYFSDPVHELRVPQVRQRLGLPQEFILYLGTLEPRKNPQGLIEAYRQLPAGVQRRYPLVLAGMPGWNQAFFRGTLDALRRRGLVRQIGYVHEGDIPALMRAATAFCFPSLYEGFGLPPLEAAACGTPVLSSTAASLPEVLGDAAVYVDPTDSEHIASGLLRLLDDESLRRSLATAGPARAALFPWENCARQTVSAYRAAA